MKNLTTLTYKNKTIELANDSIWQDPCVEMPAFVTITEIELENVDAYNQSGSITVTHDGPWEIYTDSGFAKAISEEVGMPVDWSEQGYQSEGQAHLEGTGFNHVPMSPYFREIGREEVAIIRKRIECDPDFDPRLHG